jgi:hypothetical protein
VVPFLVPEERAMLVPQLLQHHDLLDLTHQPPVTQPLDSVYSRVVVSPHLFTLHFHSCCIYDGRISGL